MAELHLPIYIYPFFFIIALLYSSVGHGGASGYLALFAFFGIVSPAVAPIALALNIIVATTSFIVYRHSGYFSIRLLLPFIVSSIPAAFIGGWIQITDEIFAVLLGSILLLTGLRLLFFRNVEQKLNVSTKTIWMLGIPVGLVLGGIAGMIGIGGGVFLSPIILLLGWANVKRTAAVSSAFIVLNSISGLTGHIVRGNIMFESLLMIGGVVITGAAIGSYMGAKRITQEQLQTALGIVLVVASLKLFY
jgi:uncharacterized protein